MKVEILDLKSIITKNFKLIKMSSLLEMTEERVSLIGQLKLSNLNNRGNNFLINIAAEICEMKSKGHYFIRIPREFNTKVSISKNNGLRLLEFVKICKLVDSRSSVNPKEDKLKVIHDQPYHN